ncbi:MAG: LysE family transporter [Leucobacter sp.]
MTLPLWLSLLAACLVISLTPGAGAINTMSNALAQGWRRSIWGILGQQLALVAHVVIVAAGVGLLVAGSPLLFGAIRYLGAAYLVFLGIRLMLIRTDAAEEGEEPLHIPESAWSMLRRGFWVNLLNPKAIVFFLAFMPQFIRVDQPQLPQYAVFLATTVCVDIAVMWGVFAAAARTFRRLTRTPRGRRTLNTVFGGLFIGVAALLVFVH